MGDKDACSIMSGMRAVIFDGRISFYDRNGCDLNWAFQAYSERVAVMLAIICSLRRQADRILRHPFVLDDILGDIETRIAEGILALFRFEWELA